MKQERFNNIARVVRSNRIKKGLSQTELSFKIGFKNGQFISNVERSVCSIPLKKINVLSSSLGIDSSEISKAMLDDYQTNLNNFTKTLSYEEKLSLVGAIL